MRKLLGNSELFQIFSQIFHMPIKLSEIPWILQIWRPTSCHCHQPARPHKSSSSSSRSKTSQIPLFHLILPLVWIFFFFGERLNKMRETREKSLQANINFRKLESSCHLFAFQSWTHFILSSLLPTLSLSLTPSLSAYDNNVCKVKH